MEGIRSGRKAPTAEQARAFAEKSYVDFSTCLLKARDSSKERAWADAMDASSEAIDIARDALEAAVELGMPVSQLVYLHKARGLAAEVCGACALYDPTELWPVVRPLVDFARGAADEAACQAEDFIRVRLAQGEAPDA